MDTPPYFCNKIDLVAAIFIQISRESHIDWIYPRSWIKNAPNLNFLVSTEQRMKQGIYQWKNQLNQTTLSGPKLNWRLWKDRLCRHSPLQQSEVWSPSSDMETRRACFAPLKGRLSVLGKAAYSPCRSSAFTLRFAELESGGRARFFIISGSIQELWFTESASLCVPITKPSRARSNDGPSPGPGP